MAPFSSFYHCSEGVHLAQLACMLVHPRVCLLQLLVFLIEKFQCQFFCHVGIFTKKVKRSDFKAICRHVTDVECVHIVIP